MLEPIRTTIVAMLRAIPDIGIVHDHERYVSDLGKLRDLYAWQPPDARSAKQVRGWFIRRVKKDESHLGNFKYDIENTWQIKGFMSLNEDMQSEIIFDGLIESISEVFRRPSQLNMVQNQLKQGVVAHGITLIDSQPVNFTGVLCHAATLELFTKHKS